MADIIDLKTHLPSASEAVSAPIVVDGVEALENIISGSENAERLDEIYQRVSHQSHVSRGDFLEMLSILVDEFRNWT